MRPLDLARLLRLPNVFTALSDIALGVLVTVHFFPDAAGEWPRLLALFLASGCLYCSGMVFNDFFDLAEDRRDRPFRPLASGRVSTTAALLIGIGLMSLGCAAGYFAGTHALILAGSLCGLVLSYDGWLKRTPFSPVAMGSCRFANVLLGLSLLPIEAFSWEARLHLAAAVGVYIVGVTLFARTEERTSRRGQLLFGAAIILAGLVAGLMMPLHLEPGGSTNAYPLLMVAFGFIVGLPVERAVRNPSPGHVQAAVKRLILGLVLLDAVLAVGLVGWHGLLIVLLLPPGLWLGKWVYST